MAAATTRSRGSSPTLDRLRNRASSGLSTSRRTGSTLRSTEKISSPAPSQLTMVRNRALLLPLRKCWLVAKSESPTSTSRLVSERTGTSASGAAGRCTATASASGPRASASGSNSGAAAPRRERSTQLPLLVQASGSSFASSGTSAAGEIAAAPGKYASRSPYALRARSTSGTSTLGATWAGGSTRMPSSMVNHQSPAKSRNSCCGFGLRSSARRPPARR